MIYLGFQRKINWNVVNKHKLMLKYNFESVIESKSYCLRMHFTFIFKLFNKL